MNLEFKIAKTDEEKEDAYRFRYKIYIEEMNRPAHADHSKRIITDWLDKDGTTLYVTNDNNIIATGRVNFKKNGPLEFEDIYGLTDFQEFYPDKVSTTTKLMLSPEYRRTPVTAQLINFIYDFGRNQGVSFDFINVNKPLDIFYEKMGYRKYKENFNHPEFGEVIPMVLVINDLDHLKKIRSPFSKINPNHDEREKQVFYEVLNKYNIYKP